MNLARFAEVFSHKGNTRRDALKLIAERFPEADFHGSLAVVKADLDELRVTPGVTEFGRVSVSKPHIDAIARASLEVAPKKFWLDVEKHGSHDFRSLELAREVGSFLESEGHIASTDHQIVRIHVFPDMALTYVPEKGPGGFPSGLFGKAIFLWEPGYRNKLALLKLASRGYRPLVVCPMGTEVIAGEALEYEPPHETAHALHGMRGPLDKAFGYALCRDLAKSKGAKFVATGEVFGSQISDDPGLLSRIEDFTGLRPVRPIGFMDMASVRREARHFKFKIREELQEWKRFGRNELEEEWLSLELKQKLEEALKTI